MSESPDAGLGPEGNLLGAALLGVFLSAIVYGMTLILYYLYNTRHGRRDRICFRLFISFLLLLDTIQLAFQIHAIYVGAVIDPSQFFSNSRAPWSLYSSVPIGLLLSTSTQFFYAYKIYQISGKSIYAPIVICALSIAELGLGIKFTVQCFKVHSFHATDPQVPFTGSALAAGVACDILITGAFVYYLHKLGRAVMLQTNKAIVLLMVYAVIAGVATLIFTIGCLVTAVKTPQTLIYAAFYCVLNQLYASALLSILNSRDHLRSKLCSSDGTKMIMPRSVEETVTQGPTARDLGAFKSAVDALQIQNPRDRPDRVILIVSETCGVRDDEKADKAAA
ncbi:hypothetical protein FA95DRAFT_1276952 [Auriscalpium vulgare]|uniref:Uncharacterized protein n=1 Tax=Auriscalpium vulgare TaxID=40419 RepID=A0ACB8R319_9AGAM|nr:hypothetical protein FA95DRAFT_1276952 [Auriscalpium vulgare]